MRIFFDVDLTLLNSSPAGWALRPRARQVLGCLKARGHEVYLWTATGQAHAQRVVQRYRLKPLVCACLDKDPNSPLLPDFIVDDDPYLVEKYGGVLVTPYRDPDPKDRELFKVLEYLDRLDPELVSG